MKYRHNDEPEPFTEDSVIKHLSSLGQAIQDASFEDLMLALIAINKAEKETA